MFSCTSKFVDVFYHHLCKSVSFLSFYPALISSVICQRTNEKNIYSLNILLRSVLPLWIFRAILNKILSYSSNTKNKSHTHLCHISFVSSSSHSFSFLTSFFFFFENQFSTYLVFFSLCVYRFLLCMCVNKKSTIVYFLVTITL